MGSEAGYLLAALGGGGDLPYHFFGSIFWRENSKTAAKFEKWARKFKIQNFFSAFGRMVMGEPYLLTAASRRRAILSSANSTKPTARGEGTCCQRGLNLACKEVPVASVGP